MSLCRSVCYYLDSPRFPSNLLSSERTHFLSFPSLPSISFIILFPRDLSAPLSIQVPSLYAVVVTIILFYYILFVTLPFNQKFCVQKARSYILMES